MLMCVIDQILISGFSINIINFYIILIYCVI